MLNIKAGKGILEKLNSLLKDEDEGTCVRLREYIVGSG